MYVTRRAWEILRGRIHKYGSEGLKKRLWNRDYSRGRYGYGCSAGDFLYPYLVEHARGGSILDLGCGEGKTENELDEQAYTECIGVDISDVAIAKAKAWSEQTGRIGKNKFYCSDIVHFVPSQEFDLILFRDSLYYVPLRKVKALLDRYSAFLKESGCFVVRVIDGVRCAPFVEIIERNFSVRQKQFSREGALLMVFQPLKGIK
jgi:SAM-dependent methyltransferase